jgi:mono/diheme cytochrome c family protein
MQRLFTVILVSLITVAVSGVYSDRAEARTAQTNKTVWDGVFTSAQAARGKEAFSTNCSGCHGPDLEGGNASSLKGDVFMLHWAEDSLNAVFTRVRSMPPRAAVPLSEATHVDILAHILSVNAFPAGNDELDAATLANIKVESKDGPGVVPNGALVEVVGCLTQNSDQSWNLTNGTDLLRTRNPNQPAPAELRTEATLSTQTYRLLYPESFAPGFRIEPHKGHKMQAKGFLIRTPNDMRINVTWLEMLGVCPQ